MITNGHIVNTIPSSSFSHLPHLTHSPRLRTKWTEALMMRREFLDSEVRKLMDKRDQTVADLERQNELLDQWAMLQWQRAAVLQPRPGSGVPGAPTSW